MCQGALVLNRFALFSSVELHQQALFTILISMLAFNDYAEHNGVNMVSVADSCLTASDRAQPATSEQTSFHVQALIGQGSM
jgi:hypothetical protein